MSQASKQSTDVEQNRELSASEKAELWVHEPAGDDRPLEVTGTVNVESSVRVPRDATEEEKKQALLAQSMIGEIDGISGVTVWEQEFDSMPPEVE